MQAMLIEDHPAAAVHAAALSEAGFVVAVTGCLAQAKAALREDVVDVLVLGETVGGRLAHDVALLAELRNPGLGTILLSERRGADADELFDLLPSLQAVLGGGTPAGTLARVALAAAQSQPRIAEHEHEDQDEPEPEDEDERGDPPVAGVAPTAGAPRPMPPILARPAPAMSPGSAFLEGTGLSLASRLRAAAAPAPAEVSASVPAQTDPLAAWRSNPARQRRLHLA